MYTLYETPEQFHFLAAELKQLVTDVASRFKNQLKTIRIGSHEDLSSPAYRKDNLYIVREGMLACSRGGANIFYFDEGDIIGLELQLLPIDTCAIWSELAVVADELPIAAVMSRMAGDWALLQQWNRLLACQMSLYLTCLASLAKNPQDAHPDVRQFLNGQTMMKQGDLADEVCTLIEGHAEVFVDGVRVGQVLPGETFGAVAALTRSRRTATVVALGDCVVMGLRRDQVQRLIETRPNTALKLIQDMARVILDLNNQIVSAHGTQPSVPVAATIS